MSLIFQSLRSQTAIAFACVFAFSSTHSLLARPAKYNHAKGDEQLTFLRQVNTKSNVEFYFTNRGVLFNAGPANGEDGLFWPRGSEDSYIYGEGLWFAAKKKLIDGKLHKLCELGYNPNSGAGWYIEGEASQVGLSTGTDGSDPSAKYISYVSPRYDAGSGRYLPGSSTVVPSPYYSWPIWDTNVTKVFDRNYYFGDYISDVNMRNVTALLHVASKPNPKPSMVSEEDIVNLYSDENTSDNPEFTPNVGYPFGIDIQEVIYSWSYGRYKDMIFVRYKVKNSSHDTLADCWLAPALDPDLDGALASGSNDGNSYVDNALLTTQPSPDPAMLSQLREPYRSDLSKLNMAVQWRNYNQPPNGKQYGWLGVSFLESPVIDQANGNIIPNDDSSALNGYGPNSLFQKNQLGLVTCKDWTISNDPLAADLRYDFLSSGEKDIFDGNYADQRLMMATGPFTLLPDSSAEATIVLTFAKVDENDYRKNFGALLLLTDFAHQVFGEVTPVVEPISNDTMGYFVNNFQVTPPDVVSEQVRPSGLTIEPAYPDPFSTTCSIRYSNAVPGNVTVIVTDELGRKVRTHSLGEIPAGEHSLALDGAGLAAGDYRVTFFENGESQSLNVVYKP